MHSFPLLWSEEEEERELAGLLWIYYNKLQKKGHQDVDLVVRALAMGAPTFHDVYRQFFGNDTHWQDAWKKMMEAVELVYRLSRERQRELERECCKRQGLAGPSQEATQC
jgi:hypothetical protein